MGSASVKARVRERDEFKCCDCGMSSKAHIAKYSKQLEVHRLNPGSRYTVNGCIALCVKCHRIRDAKIRGKKPKGWSVFAPVNSLLRRSFENYQESLEYNPPLARVVERALREFFTREGVYPPKD